MKNFKVFRQMQNRNQRFLILKIAIVSLIAVILCVVAAWSWFNSSPKTTADGINISVESSKNLLISLDNGATYHTGLDLMSEDSQQYIGASNKIKDVLTMLDITSDGQTFLRPILKQSNGSSEPDTSQNWTPANPNRAYISQTVKFRTEYPADIYMGQGTQVLTHCEDVLDLHLTGSDCGNKSNFGDFSKDCIVGALRISAINSDNELCFTMIPRSDIELYIYDGTVYLFSGDEVDTSVTMVHKYYGSDYFGTNAPKENYDVLTELTAVDGSRPTDATTKIATTTLTDEGYYEGSATVNLWLEGCDMETHLALSGGQFNIVLDFVAYENAQ